MNNVIKLTTRQEWLYEFLKARTEANPYGITTQYEIVEEWNKVCSKGDTYVITSNPSAHDKCTAIWIDIDTINKSLSKDKPIITKKFTYKIATSREEVEEFATKYLVDGLRKLKRYHSIMAKANRDSQGKLISNAGRAIDEKSKAKRFYEAYIIPGLDKEEFENDLC